LLEKLAARRGEIDEVCFDSKIQFETLAAGIVSRNQRLGQITFLLCKHHMGRDVAGQEDVWNEGGGRG
jgi:hypothetical protein